MDPVGLGLATITHADPFHRSTNVLSDVAEDAPTAVQVVALLQRTPLNQLSFTPAGLGLDTIAHADPFHRSTSVRPGPVAGYVLPTAMQYVPLAHETALR